MKEGERFTLSPTFHIDLIMKDINTYKSLSKPVELLGMSLQLFLVWLIITVVIVLLGVFLEGLIYAIPIILFFYFLIKLPYQLDKHFFSIFIKSLTHINAKKHEQGYYGFTVDSLEVKLDNGKTNHTS